MVRTISNPARPLLEVVVPTSNPFSRDLRLIFVCFTNLSSSLSDHQVNTPYKSIEVWHAELNKEVDRNLNFCSLFSVDFKLTYTVALAPVKYFSNLLIFFSRIDEFL